MLQYRFVMESPLKMVVFGDEHVYSIDTSWSQTWMGIWDPALWWPLRFLSHLFFFTEQIQITFVYHVGFQPHLCIYSTYSSHLPWKRSLIFIFWVERLVTCLRIFVTLISIQILRWTSILIPALKLKQFCLTSFRTRIF